MKDTPMQSSLMLDLFDKDKYFLRFPEISAPTLILWGTADSILDARDDHVQLKHLLHPKSHGYWLEGASHAIVLDSLASVHRLMRPFLTGDEPSEWLPSNVESVGRMAAFVEAVPSLRRRAIPMRRDGTFKTKLHGEQRIQLREERQRRRTEGQGQPQSRL